MLSLLCLLDLDLDCILSQLSDHILLSLLSLALDVLLCFHLLELAIIHNCGHEFLIYEWVECRKLLWLLAQKS